jgi:CelD/BcsL family acetyltransferase involved in cellulose biosynthesis
VSAPARRADPRLSGAPLTVRAVTTEDEFDRIAPVWDRLVEEAGVDNPFLTHECMRAAWSCFAGQNRLLILVVMDGQSAVGLAPLMIGAERLLGQRVRRVGFIHHVAVERLDFIIVRDHARVYAAVWDYLRARSSEWDLLKLPQIPGASRTLCEIPRCAARDGFLSGFWRSSDAMYLRVRGAWEPYLERLDSRHRTNLRRRLRRLFREHTVDLDQVTPDDDLQAALDEGLRIEAAAWKGEAGTAIASRPEMRRFYTELARRTAARGWLRLRFLTVDGRRIAFSYALVFRNVLYSLKGGYDPAESAHSPFTLLSYLMLREAFERGLSRYEFLGPPDPWKLAWTRRSHPHCWLFVLPGSLWGRAVHWTKFRLVPQWRKNRALARLRRALLDHLVARRLAGAHARVR